jgi:2-oxoglutarate dehydrogenase E2 component (dihydrolipoamide succinyltransferase)
MIEVKVPILPESINEATVAVWHKKPGDFIELDDVIVEIETDKVVLEIPAEDSGVLTEIKAKEGETVGEQQVLGIMEKKSQDDSKETPNTESDSTNKEETSEEVTEEIKQDPEEVIQEDPKEIKREETQEEVIQEPQQNSTEPSDKEDASFKGNRLEERVPMNRIRKTIAKRLHSATQNTAMLTTFNEVDMSAILSMRSTYKEAFEKKYSVKLGFMSFFVKAAVESLKKFPTVNAYIDGDDIVYHAYCDVSVAISSDRGLVVPVLRDAHKMAMHDIEKAITSTPIISK